MDAETQNTYIYLTEKPGQEGIFMTRIMIADDGPFMRSFIEGLLLDKNYEVVGKAENGEEAVAMYKTLRPDLLTLDITMPVMNGLEALRLIKEYDPSAKVIMVSANGEHETVKEAIRSGASSFIVKPFTADVFFAVLQDVLDEVEV